MSKKYLRAISIVVIVSFLFFPQSIYALPEGEQVVSGSASFDRSQDNTLNVNQYTDKMIANYQGFSIARPEAVNFYQPSSSSIALNRVVGVDPSSILGTLTATGKIFLINPHGIIFGEGCRIDTAGMVASTLNITDANFLAGRYSFYGQGGSVINQGYISAPGGYVSLLGQTVENTGVIEAELGSVALASGEAITLNLDPQGLISVVVDEATTQNLEAKEDAVKNTGTITADGGKVILTAKALSGVFDRAINTEGIIEANALNSKSGEVILEANQRVNVAGTISAEGGTVRVDSQGADISAEIIAQKAIFNMNDGDTVIDGASYFGDNTGTYPGSGSFDLWDNKHIIVIGDLAISGGNITLWADKNGDHSGDLRTFAALSTDGGGITLKGHNIELNGLLSSGGGDIFLYTPLEETTLTDGGDIIHHALGDVETSGGEFRGEASRDYILRNNARIETGDGIIDILADNNIILWSDGTDSVNTFIWKYAGGDRGYKFREFGYYYYDDGIKYVTLAQGDDIGKDGTTLDAGAWLTYEAFSPVELYTKFYSEKKDKTYTWHTEFTRNADEQEHLATNGNLYGWEDQYSLGDQDFDDAILDFTHTFQEYTNDPDVGSFISSNTDVYLTADEGYIWQSPGMIYANNLMLSAQTGITGSGPNNAIVTKVNNLSAQNTTGDIRLRNKGDLTIADLSGSTGPNGITGYDGISNGSGTVHITVVSNPIPDPDLYLNAPINTSDGDVILIADEGGIYDNNDADVDVTSSNLTMSARDAIGASGLNGAIDTTVENLWATATDGDVYINETDAVTLQDIQALGSIIDITTGGDTTVYKMLAEGPAPGLKGIYLDVYNGNVSVGDTTTTGNVTAQCFGSADTLVDFDIFDGYLNVVNGSSIEALTRSQADAIVDLDVAGDVTVTGGSRIYSEAWLSGSDLYGTSIIIASDSNVTVEDGSEVTAAVIDTGVNTSGTAIVDLDAVEDISITDSSVLAEVQGEGHAEINMSTGGSINSTNSSIHAEANASSDTALICMNASEDINILGGEVSASEQSGLAAVVALTGGSINATGQVSADSEDGIGLVALLAEDNIFAGDVSASGGYNVIPLLEALIENFFSPVTIGAQNPYGSAVLLGSLDGDITLGDISADLVLAAALGLDGDGSIKDEGDVSAHLLGLIARNDIGTADYPINTDVDILSAYSWDEGNIYINEADDIELGLYLPIFDDGQIAAIGASVAANDGIVHITSEGDIIVNSIVSPRGGVFLNSTGGSIFAGDGWCPHLTEGFIDDNFGCLADFIKCAIMDLSDTDWALGGYEYFSPIMFGCPELPYGPNVIAGGYSYFSAPHGTIGVGLPGVPVDGDNWYNPLHVCIQVIEGSHSALPEISDALTASPGLAGLTLRMGGSTAPGFTMDTGDGNGPLGVSGAIMGIVRPGVTAVTGVFPSPDIAYISLSPLSPPGYVFYEDNAFGCCPPLDDEPRAEITNSIQQTVQIAQPLQIWPEPRGIQPVSVPYLFPKDFRAYYEILNPHRVASYLTFTPTEYFAYHPLTPTDLSAFDQIALDIGFYDFIEDRINLKKGKAVAPYFGQVE